MGKNGLHLDAFDKPLPPLTVGHQSVGVADEMRYEVTLHTDPTQANRRLGFVGSG